MIRVLRESALYSAGAAAAFAVDFASLWLMVEYGGVDYLLAATLSFVAGTVVVYWVAVRHAFSYRRLDDRRTEFFWFTTIGAAGIVLNLTLMYGLVDGLGLHYLVAKIGAATVTFLANFGLRRWLLFTEHKPSGSSSPPGIRSEQRR